MRAITGTRSAATVLLLTSLGCVEPFEHDYSADEVTPPPLHELPDREPEIIVSADGYATLGGVVKDWLTLAAEDGVELNTVGMSPPATATSTGAEGAYSMDVLVAGVFWMKASGEGYVATYEYVRMPQGDYPDKSLYVVSEAKLDEVSAVYGQTRSASCSTVLVEVKAANGQGLKDITGVRLQGVSYEGPYFLGPQNQADAARTATSESGRVVFFNVCEEGSESVTAGANAQLTVEQPGVPAPLPMYLNLYPGGATRGVVTLDPNAVPEPVLPSEGLDFAEHIYPIFAREACASCHSPGGQAEATGMNFDGTPTEVYALLREGSARINLEDPSASLVLSKPLYEEPANHPNASFPSVEHADYKAIHKWIEEGATHDDGEPPDTGLPTNVSFVDDVFPRFAALSCNICHSNTVAEGDLVLTGTPEAVYANLMVNSVVPGSYETSLLYTSPNTDFPEEEHGGFKPVTGAEHDYARYVAGWIAEGASY